MAAKEWLEEFRNEIVDDHRSLLEKQSRQQKASSWSFKVALERTQLFYRERLTGFARCGSISENELKELLKMVAQMGSKRFPA